jgi:hypothetical protein
MRHANDHEPSGERNQGSATNNPSFESVFCLHGFILIFPR